MAVSIIRVMPMLNRAKSPSKNGPKARETPEERSSTPTKAKLEGVDTTLSQLTW